MRLEDIRRSANISREKASVLLGVSFSTIARWEQGRSRVPAKAIAKLASAYRVSEKKILDAIRIPLGDIEALKAKKGA